MLDMLRDLLPMESGVKPPHSKQCNFALDPVPSEVICAPAAHLPVLRGETSAEQAEKMRRWRVP
jgi:hypothetical protein